MFIGERAHLLTIDELTAGVILIAALVYVI
jgi:hypothetical protein